jgi:hypothetical protein
MLSGVDCNFRGVTGTEHVLGNPNDTVWACGTNGLIFKTTDGGQNWTRYCNGGDEDNNDIQLKGRNGINGGNGGNALAFGSNDIFIPDGILNYSGKSYSVYPNPTNSFITIDLVNYRELIRLRLADISGNVFDGR